MLIIKNAVLADGVVYFIVGVVVFCAGLFCGGLLFFEQLKCKMSV